MIDKVADALPDYSDFGRASTLHLNPAKIKLSDKLNTKPKTIEGKHKTNAVEIHPMRHKDIVCSKEVICKITGLLIAILLYILNVLVLYRSN